MLPTFPWKLYNQPCTLHFTGKLLTKSLQKYEKNLLFHSGIENSRTNPIFQSYETNYCPLFITVSKCARKQNLFANKNFKTKYA